MAHLLLTVKGKFSDSLLSRIATKNRAQSLDDYENGINLGILNGMHRIFIEKGARGKTSKHVSFEKNVYLMMRSNQYVTSEDIIKNFDDAHD